MPDLLNPYSGTHRSERSSLTHHLFTCIFYNTLTNGLVVFELQKTNNNDIINSVNTLFENETSFCIIISIWIFLAIAATACKAHSVESSTLSFVPQNALYCKNTSYQRQLFTRDLGAETPIKAYHLDVQCEPALSKPDLLALMWPSV